MNHHRKNLILSTLANPFSAAHLAPAFAQAAWPSRPITLIVRNSPSGPASTLARRVSTAVSAALQDMAQYHVLARSGRVTPE